MTYRKDYYEKNKARILAKYKEYYEKHKEKRLAYMKEYHINNDGNIHRQKIGRAKIYLWLKTNHLPNGFQTLCFNCNSGKNVNKGICPHRLLKNTLPIEVMWSN